MSIASRPPKRPRQTGSVHHDEPGRTRPRHALVQVPEALRTVPSRRLNPVQVERLAQVVELKLPAVAAVLAAGLLAEAATGRIHRSHRTSHLDCHNNKKDRD